MRTILLTLIICLFSIPFCRAQSGFLIGIRGITPSNNFLDSKYTSVGVNLGYGKAFLKGRIGTDLTAFADFLSYKHDLPDLRRLDATTFYTGLAINPWYCFNPQNEDVRLSLSLSVKAGYNQGWGIVTQADLSEQDKQIENKTTDAGFAVAVAPAVNVIIPINIGSIGISLGYDSSNFGKGINKLKSAYYPPVNYSSGGVFLGFTFRFGRKAED